MSNACPTEHCLRAKAGAMNNDENYSIQTTGPHSLFNDSTGLNRAAFSE